MEVLHSAAAPVEGLCAVKISRLHTGWCRVQGSIGAQARVTTDTAWIWGRKVADGRIYVHERHRAHLQGAFQPLEPALQPLCVACELLHDIPMDSDSFAIWSLRSGSGVGMRWAFTFGVGTRAAEDALKTRSTPQVPLRVTLVMY